MSNKYWIESKGATRLCEIGSFVDEFALSYPLNRDETPKFHNPQIKTWDDCINIDLSGIWKFEPILPIKKETAYALSDSSYEELPSPIHSERLAKYLGVKDFVLFPCIFGRSGTFKDIEASFIIGKVKDWGLKQPISFHSTGNTARAYHEYSIAAGIKSAGFFPLSCINKFIGTNINTDNDLYAFNAPFQLISKMAKQWATEHQYLHLAPLFWKVMGKTPLGYHIMNAVPETTNIVQTIAGGYGVLGIFEAIKRLMGWGIVNKMPKFNLFQLEGVDTFARLLPYKKDIFETDLELPSNSFELTLQSTNPLSTFNYVRNICELSCSNISSVHENTVIKYANEFVLACDELNIPISFVDEKSPFISYAGLRQYAQNVGFKGNEVISFVITGANRRKGSIPNIKHL